jgi:putative membrane protein
MRRSVCALAAALAVAGGLGARAEAPGQTPSGATPAATAVEGVPKPRPPVARPPMFAASSAATATRMTPELREDRRFIRDAAGQSRFELEASRLALAKSGSEAVKALAGDLVRHHNAIGPELVRLLHARNMAPPMLANDQRKVLNRLGKLAGRRFDEAYLQTVGLAQREDVAEFERAAARLVDAQLKAWVDQTLPAMRAHQLLAERAMPAGPRLARMSGNGMRMAPARGALESGSSAARTPAGTRPLPGPAANRPVAAGVNASNNP